MIKYEEYLNLSDSQKEEYNWRFKDKRKPRSTAIQTFITVTSLSLAVFASSLMLNTISTATTPPLGVNTPSIFEFKTIMMFLLILGNIIMIADLFYVTTYNKKLKKDEQAWFLNATSLNPTSTPKAEFIKQKNKTTEPSLFKPSFVWGNEEKK